MLALLGLSAVVPARAATINVNPGDSIQAAVDAAASGDTINIAAGDYEQQVVVMDKNLTFAGNAGATLKAPAAMTSTLSPLTTRLAILGMVRSTVNVSGLAFDGNRSGAANARLTGVYHLSASGTVSNCSFQGFRSEPRIARRESAYIAANSVGAGADVTHVEVLNSTFMDNEDSILLLGDELIAPTELRQTLLVQGNTIIGVGAGTTAFQFGVCITLGAAGEVRNNTIRDYLSNGGDFLGRILGSAAVLIGDRGAVVGHRIPVTARPVLIEGNMLVNNLGGVNLFFADGSRAVNNQIQGGGTETGFSNEGGIALSGNDVGAISNRISHSSIGINLLASPVLGT
ncbi:MAG TPA: hypothetical protein VFV34_28705, partial [Blastocatellia bacterium]|nr:hypothetical protein [Blastocatellia bacterium]